MSHHQLISGLVERGAITADWQEAFLQVPRERFVPERIWIGPTADREVDRAEDPSGWAQAVASDIPVVTHRDESGTPTSSCSMPYMVATMLRHLDVHPGQRVLEIGTGTGWNAALLAHRNGSEQVTSIEVDPLVAAAAERALTSLGLQPHLVVADGQLGAPEGGLFDRIIATCAVQNIPVTWLEQLAPGGILVAPFATTFHNGVLLRLSGEDLGRASGTVVDDAQFMAMTGHAWHRDVMAWVTNEAAAKTDLTWLDPRHLHDLDFAFTAGLHLPGVIRSFGYGHGASEGEMTAWLAHPDTGSWASADYAPGQEEFTTSHHGSRDLWTELEGIYRDWFEQGKPSRTSYQVTATSAGTRIHLAG